MKKNLKFSWVVLVVLLCPYANAAWIEGKMISSLKAQGNGVSFSLEGFKKTDSEIDCESSAFWMPLGDTNYDARLSFLLAAKLSNKLIDVSYYECEAGLIKVGSVRIN